MNIRKEDIDYLLSDKITKKEYSSLVNRINERVNSIWHSLCSISKRKVEWWAFQNDRELGDGNGSTGGEFDPDTDDEWITIIGDSGWILDKYYPYNDGFPTRFLWEKDWEIEVSNTIKEAAKLNIEKSAANKLKRAENKRKKAEMKSLISSKLSKEELKYIQFK